MPTGIGGHGSEMERRLPGRGETEVVVPVVVPVVVDVQTLRVEVADVDAVAIRVEYCPFPSVAPGVEGYPPICIGAMSSPP